MQMVARPRGGIRRSAVRVVDLNQSAERRTAEGFHCRADYSRMQNHFVRGVAIVTAIVLALPTSELFCWAPANGLMHRAGQVVR